MNTECVTPSSYMPMAINISVHVLILFTILSMLFMFYISKVARNALNKEISHGLGDAVDAGFAAINKNINQNLNAGYGNSPMLDKISNMHPEIANAVQKMKATGRVDVSKIGHSLNGDLVDKLRKSYEKVDKTVETHNNWLFNSIIITNVSLFIFVTMLIVILLYQCEQCIPIKHILLENAVTFFFVGIIEYFFFTKIAVKYIPSKPSLIVNSFFDSVEKQLA